MSTETTDSDRPTDELDEDELAVFERIAKRYPDEPVGEIANAVVQSESNEEANS